MTSIAEINNLTLLLGNRKVLDDVTLEVQAGEILALLGPNGSGKTTLLKVLAFLLKPDSGEVKFQGEKIADGNLEKMRLQSTLVFQKTLLFGTSVFNNVAYGLKMRKMSKALVKEEVERVLELVKLKGFEKRAARKLSGGEQQRVALARALVLRTKLLLLDEPTANLDPKNASILEEVILKVNRELKTTIVLATHNMFEAKTLPHRAALINSGKIAEVGAAADIFSQLSRNLASFGAVENVFVGRTLMTDAGTTIVDIGNNVQIETVVQMKPETSIFISPKDIVLSKKPLESSARNLFKGRITQVSEMGSLARLTVDVGKLFMVQITKRSFDEMALNLGSEIYITFKASSVQEI